MSIIGALIALLAAVLVYWLVSLFAPVIVAAIAALLVFFALLFNGDRVYGGRF